MRQIDDGLNPASENHQTKLIEHECKQQRRNQIGDNLHGRDDKRIYEDFLRILQQKHILEVFESRPIRAQDSFAWIKILERNDDAEHRNDAEDEQP